MLHWFNQLVNIKYIVFIQPTFNHLLLSLMQTPQKWSILLQQLDQSYQQLQRNNTKLQKQLQACQQSKGMVNGSITENGNNQIQNIKEKSKDKLKYNKDQLKILKLYSYKNWQQFMAWVDQKLEESGESLSSNEEEDNEEKQDSQIKRVLSEILEQPDFEESYSLEKPEDKNDKNTKADPKGNDAESEAELLAMENGKLRRQNIQLKSKLTQIRALYMKNLNFQP